VWITHRSRRISIYLKRSRTIKRHVGALVVVK